MFSETNPSISKLCFSVRSCICIFIYTCLIVISVLQDITSCEIPALKEDVVTSKVSYIFNVINFMSSEFPLG